MQAAKFVAILAAVWVSAGAAARDRCPFDEFAPENRRELAYRTPLQEQILGSCFTHAVGDGLSHFALGADKKPIPLSVDYLLALQAMEDLRLEFILHARKPRTLSDLLTPKRVSSNVPVAFSNSGHLDPKLDLIAKFGIVPAADWKPKVSVEKFLADGGLEKLFSPGGAYHERFRELEARAKKAQAKYSLPPIDIADEYQALVKEALEQTLGVSFQMKFTVDGRRYDPMTFQRNFLDVDGLDYEEFQIVTKADAKENSLGDLPLGSFVRGVSHREHPGQFREGYDFKKPVKADAVTQKVRDAIDRSVPVILSVYVPDERHFEKGAVLDSTSTEVPASHPTTLHAMQVVGYALNKDGTVAYWKMKNSWGPGSGDQGYVYITPNYIHTNSATFAVIHRKEPPPIPPRAPFWRRLLGN